MKTTASLMETAKAFLMLPWASFTHFQMLLLYAYPTWFALICLIRVEAVSLAVVVTTVHDYVYAS
jgi:hypothetical protein